MRDYKTNLAQTLSEFDRYFDALARHPKDAGNLWIQFTDKWKVFKELLLTEVDPMEFSEFMSKSFYFESDTGLWERFDETTIDGNFRWTTREAIDLFLKHKSDEKKEPTNVD